jgi:L-threonylcarbamoyladenylate synthase
VTQIHPADDASIRALAARLRAGELVAVPTETVYGLAADALDEAAVRRIFLAKGRPLTDPLILHVADAEHARQIVHWSAEAEALAQRFWPGPLTLVLPKRPLVPDLVTAGLPSVAVRVPAHPAMLRLLREFGGPLAAPSANPFGYVSPTTADHVVDGLGGRVLHVLDGGPCTVGLESTIVDLREPGRPVLLRPGGIPVEAIEAVLGLAVGRRRAAGAVADAQPAPGMLTQHYSPRTPVILHEAPLRAEQAAALPADAAVLFVARVADPRPNWRWLSEGGDVAEAGRRLYAVLRELDRAGFTAIHCELAPPAGLGAALNDRLRRAAARG